jgi:hypothetical protein
VARKERTAHGDRANAKGRRAGAVKLLEGTALPRDTRITIRDPEARLRKFVSQIGCCDLDRWQGDRLSVVFCTHVSEPVFTGPTPPGYVYQGRMRDLRAVFVNMKPPFGEYVVEEQPGFANGPVPIIAWELQAGDIVVVQRRNKLMHYTAEPWRTADLTFCINGWPDAVANELSVARDAVMAHDRPRAIKIARHVLPKGWPLFVALAEKERRSFADRRVT